VQISDDIRLGPVFIPNSDNAGPSLQELGVGPMGRVYVWDVVPVTLQAAGVAASQTPAAAGNLALTAGTGATSVTRSDGTVVVQLDVPRCVTVSAAGLNTATFTIYGYDQYGQAMSQLIAAPSTSTVATTKAFSQVSRIAISGAAGSAITAGFNDKLGLPFRVTDVGYVSSVKWAAALAADAGTFVAADTTSPATTSTTDVRGCYTPSSAANGTRRLVMAICLPALAVGPNATRIGAAGVTQA
jgi:hypothetical protein